MPKVLEVNGYTFRFFNNENNEDAHIHYSKGNGNSKFWLVPEVRNAYSYGFTVREQRDIKNLIKLNSKYLNEQWNEYFKK